MTAVAGSSPPEPPQYPIESVDNALRLLLFVSEQGQVRLTDVSKYLGVASSTAHRLLAMLQYRGFVRQNAASRAYEPGPAIGAVAFSFLRRLDVRAKARPVLEQLNAELGETVHLGRLEGRDVHFLDSIESSRAVRVGSRMGRTMPAHCTSTGKAMLSRLSAEQLHALYPSERLEALTERSHTSRRVLERDLEETRRRGYAISQEESEEGVISVAVALGTDTEILYAVNASAPTTRITPELRDRMAAAVLQRAAEIAKLMV